MHLPDCMLPDGAEPCKGFQEATDENERLRAVLLNIQSKAETGFPIDGAKLATRCRHALCNDEQKVQKP